MAIIQGAASGNLAEVDSSGNQKVVTPTDPTAAGYVRMLDSRGNAVIATEIGGLGVSQETILLVEQVDGSVINTNKWTYNSSGMTIAQASGFVTLNAGSALTANAWAILSSILSVPLYGVVPTVYRFRLKLPIQPQANATIEFGLGTATTTTLPTDGAFFRYGASGAFTAVVNNGGTETASAALTPIANNACGIYEIIIVEDLVQFIIGDEIVAEIDNPAALAFPVNAGHQPVFFRVYNGGSAPSQAPQISFGQVLVTQQVLAQSKLWSEAMTGMGQGAYQSPTAFTQTANHANSASPSSATLSNTAAGYTTLGGRFQFAAVAGQRPITRCSPFRCRRRSKSTSAAFRFRRSTRAWSRRSPRRSSIGLWDSTPRRCRWRPRNRRPPHGRHDASRSASKDLRSALGLVRCRLISCDRSPTRRWRWTPAGLCM